MRFLFCLSIFLLSINCFTQINFEVKYNVDLFKPYSEEARKNISAGERIKSNTLEATISYDLISKNINAFSLGFGYRYTNLIVRDKIHSYYDGHYLIHNKLDLITNSHFIGLNVNYKRTFFIHENKLGELIIASNIYVYEHYDSHYDNSGQSASGYPYIWYENPNYFFSSANLSIGYKQFLIQKEKFNLGAKVSIGTNLYSDWDLFRKYVWLGVGLEMGFGKGKALFTKRAAVPEK
ncbi:MAG: hypothetical protein V4638_00745 [Bacteroidota bacterium]